MKLFKRSQSPTAPWYVKFQVKRKQYLWSTKTTDKFAAKNRAAEYHDRVVSGSFHVAASMKARNGLPTFKDLFEEYGKLPSPNEASKARNIAAMRAILTCAGLTDKHPIDRLVKGVGATWLRDGAGNEANRNSVLRKAKSLFARRAVFSYAIDIPMPLFQPFLATPSLKETEHRPEIPTQEQIDAVRAGLVPGTDLYNAFILATYAGLRSGEIQAARWDWLDGSILYVGGREFVAKSRRWRAVRMAPDTLALLHRNGSERICGDNANQLVLRGLPIMLRGYGFTSRNPVHSLRRWYGSQVAHKHGLWAAKNALGHSTQAVTEQSYARQLDLTPGLSLAPSVSPGDPPPGV